MKNLYLLVLLFFSFNAFSQDRDSVYYTTLSDRGKIYYEGYVLLKFEIAFTGNGFPYRNSTLYKHGQGTSYFTNETGAYRKGNFNFDKLNGYGEFVSRAYTYKGNYVNDLKSGKGIESSDGSLGGEKYTYEGYFVNDLKNGKGKLEFPL